MTSETTQLDDLVASLVALAKRNRGLSRTVFDAAQSTLHKAEKQEQRQEARRARFTRKGDRRPTAAVEQGERTKAKNRRERSRRRSSARRAMQKATEGERRFRRKMSATAIVLTALEADRWYVRGEIRSVCSGLPNGTLSALLGRNLLRHPALLERERNPAWDGIRGSLRARGTGMDAKRRSKWRYRLSAIGEITRAEILSDPAKWTSVERWRNGLENAGAVPQSHSERAWPQFLASRLVERHRSIE